MARPVPGGGAFATRRHVLRILAFTAPVGLLGWRLGACEGRRVHRVERVRALLGTHVRLQVVGHDREAAAAAADSALARMTELEMSLSRYRADGELARLHANGELEHASDALLDVLQLAEQVSRLGDGAFDVTIQPVLDVYREQLERAGGLPAPEDVERALERVNHRAIRIDGRRVRLASSDARITLDGIGKGYVVDRAVDVLRSRGFPNVLLDAGGDLVAGGQRGYGQPWRLGIRHPRGGLGVQARFDTQDRAVATSGDYLQPFAADYSQHHILDPRSGRSAPELASCTVVAEDAARADALATLVMVLGVRRGRSLLEDLPGCEGYLITKRLDVVRTSGFEVA